MAVLRALLFAVLGAVAGYALTATLAMLLVTPPAADSGGTAMGIFFGLAPVGGILGAAAGIVFALARKRKAG